MREEVDQLLAELETKIERVRALYDQYFLGIERTEPLVPRKDVERRFAVLQPMTLRNTALRFRYQTLAQRWTFLQTHWNKVLRAIEAGTYAPHVARASRRRGGTLPGETFSGTTPSGVPAVTRDPAFLASEEQTGEGGGELYESFSDLVRSLREEHDEPASAPGRPSVSFGVTTPSSPLGAVAPSETTRPGVTPPSITPTSVTVPRTTPPSNSAARPARPGASSVPGMSEGELRDLHRQYQTARGEPVKYESLVSNLERQVPGLLDRLKCQGVRFEVAERDGRVILRAVPKK